MSMRRSPLSLILVVIHALGIIVGIYAIMTLWDWVPRFDYLFGDDLISCEKSTKQILFVFVPIGIALFCNQLAFDDSIPCKVVTGIGLGLMLVPVSSIS